MAVDPATMMTIGSVAAPVVGSMLGGLFSSGDKDEAKRRYAEALAQFAGIKVPGIAEQSISLEDYVNQGELSPELLQAIGLGDTELANISSDPRLRSNQMSALEQLSQLASGQLSSGEQAAFTLARNNAASEMQAKNAQLMQEMAQRGQAGSGAELLSRLTANQAGAQAMQNAQLQEAQAIQQARQAALQQQAGLASSIRSQDYSEAANLANARDAIARYNAQNAQQVAGANVAAKNNAQATNLANRQNIANMNTGNANVQEQYNKGLIGQNYDKQLELARAKAGALTGAAQVAERNASNTAGMWGTIGQGVGQGIQSYQQNQQKQEQNDLMNRYLQGKGY